MKVAIVSDLQAHNWASYPETDQRGVNLRLLDTVRELKRLHGICLHNSADKFIVLGDIFEARSQISVSVLNAVFESFYRFYASGIEVILLVGNHDRTSVGGEHALKVFKSFATVIDRPMTIPMTDKDGNFDGNIVGIPFHPNPESIRKAIKKEVNRDTRLLLLHCGISSTILSSGKVWGEGISIEDLPQGNTISLLGHYHRWTEIIPRKAWYLGSMTQVDFGDSGTEKFYAVYNSENHKVIFHHTTGPKFINLVIDSVHSKRSVEMGTVLTPADLDMDKYLVHIPGNFIKIQRVPPGFTDLKSLAVVLRSLGARHVTYDLQVVAVPEQTAEESQEWSTMPVEEMLQPYVEQSPMPTNLVLEEVVETGLKILTQTMNGEGGASESEIENGEGGASESEIENEEPVEVEDDDLEQLARDIQEGRG